MSRRLAYAPGLSFVVAALRPPCLFACAAVCLWSPLHVPYFGQNHESLKWKIQAEKNAAFAEREPLLSWNLITESGLHTLPQMKNLDAAAWIRLLGLAPHPEGGCFRRTYACEQTASLPGRSGERHFSTAIFFLLQAHEKSRLHRLKSDELWHFHCGSSLTLHLLHPCGEYESLRLGLDPEHRILPQAVVPAGTWFGATVDQPGGFSLASCTVAPGFDFADFEIASRKELLFSFPTHAGIIERLTDYDE